MASRYITTTLPYVNADPHIGFASEIVAADALARYWRLSGHQVFFNTGTDEHGQKIFEKSVEAEQNVQEYVDHYAGEFKKLGEALGLSYDRFIRTTEPTHEKAAQELWRRCDAAGDIYKKKYKGLYCKGDEMFLRESDLVNGRCPNHPNIDPIMLEEENYFFRFSKYADRLLEYLSRENVVVPDWRREEAINFVKTGLEDFSISRERARLTWGVDVPGDDTQVMYVWFDALTNYISTLGWPEDENQNFKKFWIDGTTLQLAGKDQVRFQSLIWQAMLMSAGIKGTDTVLYHGFINSGGQKMSKSLGNIISPYDLVKKYGTEATRYVFLRHVHPFDDTDVTWERLDEWYEAGLVNGLGNIVARVMKLAEDNLEEAVARPEPGFPSEYTLGIDSYNFNTTLDYIWSRIQAADARMTLEAPYKLVKTDLEAGRQIIRELVVELYWIARFLNPFMPETSEKIKATVLANKKPENLFPRLEKVEQ